MQEENMQDQYKDEISDEERAILAGDEPKPAPDAEKDEPKEEGPEPEAESKGEEAPEEKPETEQTPEQQEQEQQAEEMGLEVVTDEKTGKQYVVDEDGTRIPPARFAKIYRDAKEGERTKDKLDLFKKLGPEGYYKAYPDEKPEDYQPQAETRTAQPAAEVADIGTLKVMYPENVPADQRLYEGMTLREVHAVDPVFAINLQNSYHDQQRQEREKVNRQTEETRQSAARELETFANELSRETFKKEASALSKEEEAKITDVVGQVVKWMNETNRGGGNISDAYFLMNKEGLLKKVADTASRAALKSITERKGPASIDTSQGGAGKETGFEALEKMTPEQLEKHLDGLNDAAMSKFLKEAPKSIRDKLPSAPWK